MQFSRILVRAANWVGDAVMSLPALRAIRARFPEAHIAVLARPWVADLYAREPFADQVIPYTAGRGAKDLAGKWRAAADLRARKFDCAILLQNAFEAAALAWLARIPRRIGYDRDGRGRLLTDAVPVPRPGEIGRHQRFYYLELLRRAGVLSGFPADDTVRLVGVARDAGGEAWVGVSPGAAFGSAKRWPPERFAEAAVEVASNVGAPVALFGSADERLLCEQVESLIAGRARVVNFAGQTSLRQFIDLAAACRVFLTNDSGAMHIASALGVPTVAVFGATDDAATGPAGERSRIVREPVDCSPCLLRECPIDHRCMTRVAAGRVAREALELLK
jgi:heptosyltransferase-2